MLINKAPDSSVVLVRIKCNAPRFNKLFSLAHDDKCLDLILCLWCDVIGYTIPLTSDISSSIFHYSFKFLCFTILSKIFHRFTGYDS